MLQDTCNKGRNWRRLFHLFSSWFIWCLLSVIASNQLTNSNQNWRLSSLALTNSPCFAPPDMSFETCRYVGALISLFNSFEFLKSKVTVNVLLSSFQEYNHPFVSKCCPETSENEKTSLFHRLYGLRPATVCWLHTARQWLDVPLILCLKPSQSCIAGLGVTLRKGTQRPFSLRWTLSNAVLGYLEYF